MLKTMLRIRVSEKNVNTVITGASSILNPVDNTVMFVGKKFSNKLSNLARITGCLVFVLPDAVVDDDLKGKHIIRFVENPRKSFGEFLEANCAEDLPPTEYKNIDGAMVSVDSVIGENVRIMPFAFIDRDTVIGDGTIIHSGVRVLPRTAIGRNCEIGDNTVLGYVGLAYEGDQRIPQIGGITIGNNVAVGANCVVSRGAIEDTIIKDRCKIDSCSFISHNDILEEGVMVVGGATCFGSVHLGRESYVSGEAVIKNGVSVGDGAFIGMGSVINKDVPGNVTVFTKAHNIKVDLG